MRMIEVIGLKKSFGKLKVLENVNFTVEKGDVIAVIGPSGSGKSTMLRCLIDLEKMDGGTVIVEGNPLLRDGQYVPHNQVKNITSRMGMAFQNFNLFPHMTVRKNLVMPAETVKKMDSKTANKRCEELLGKVGLLDKIDEKPNNLSGGQKQRVAIARALMLSPDIMLFDEPTSALDPQLTTEVLGVIKKLALEHMTMIVVTHEMAFARDVANKVLFMCDGEICEEGTPAEIFANPKNPKTIEFLSSVLRENNGWNR